jgi:hypothetical protein
MRREARHSLEMEPDGKGKLELCAGLRMFELEHGGMQARGRSLCCSH